MNKQVITYLRHGRRVRATGVILSSYPNGSKKVKPTRISWGAILVSAEEIKDGKTKGPVIHMKPTEKKALGFRKKRSPKPPPIPKWRKIAEKVRIAHTFGDQFIPTDLAMELVQELESAQTMFSGSFANAQIQP